MSPLLQHLLVLLLVIGCAVVVGWQLVNTFRGRSSRIGSCCAAGCAAAAKPAEAPKVVFFPAESLIRRSRAAAGSCRSARDN
jgi:hypothetical protein